MTKDIRMTVREAAVINLLDVTELGDNFIDLVKTELWCLREGIDTEQHPEIWDSTLGAWPTSTVINYVLDTNTEKRHEAAAKLLCTIRELS